MIDVPGSDLTNTGGYLREVVGDAESGPGRNSSQNPAPILQTSTFEYTEQPGGFPANLRGYPTARIDPRGIRYTYLVNELDQVIVTVRAADVSESPERDDLKAFAYERITLFDHNDNVIERRIQNKDTLDSNEVGDFIVHRYTYDILDQMTSETLDVPSDAKQPKLEILNTYAYDESQNLVEKVRGASKPDEAAKDELFYDERDILVSYTRGADEDEESTIRTEIDERQHRHLDRRRRWRRDAPGSGWL
ncbi:MAG: hypothetical protein V3T83_14080 [Acidobacteriota bacterium]